MKRILRLCRISVKSLFKRNSGNKLLLAAVWLIAFIPVVLYNVTGSILATVSNQRSAVYGTYTSIYYRDCIQELRRLSGTELKELLPGFQYDNYGVFYTAETIPIDEKRSINVGFADGEAIRLGCITLKEGRLPEQDHEIALTESAAKALGDHSQGEQISVGDETYVICGIVKDFGRLWKSGELQKQNGVTPVNAFVTESRLAGLFEKTRSITEQVLITEKKDIINPNPDTARLFFNDGARDAAENFTIPPMFIVLLYAISLLVVIVVLLLNRTGLFTRIRCYLLLGMEKRDATFVLMFEMMFILLLGLISGSTAGLLMTIALLKIILRGELQSPVIAVNVPLSAGLLLSLSAGLAIVFWIWSRHISENAAFGTEVHETYYKAGDCKVSILKLETFRNLKTMIAAAVLILFSCTLISYGIVYSRYYSENETDADSTAEQKGYDFRLSSKLFNAPPLTDEETGEQITPLFFTNNYEKNGMDEEILDSIRSIEGVVKVLAYRENQKMDLLLKKEDIDPYFDGRDAVADGEYHAGLFDNCNDPGMIKNTFHYEPDDVLVSSEVVGMSRESLENLSSSVIEGKIDYEKLAAGEEVIFRVPAYKLTEMDLGGITAIGILPTEPDDPDGVIMTQIHVGDTVTLSGLLTDKPLNGGVPEAELSSFYRKDVGVKIGAILRTADSTLESSRINAACSILTANEALDELDIPARYSVVSIFTDTDADNEKIAEELQTLGLSLPNMTLENRSSDVRTYKILNLLVAIFSVTLITIIVVITFAVLTILQLTKTRLNLPTFRLYRVNGLGFRKLIRILALQLLTFYVAGVSLSYPLAFLLIRTSFHVVGAASYYFSNMDFLSVGAAVLGISCVSFVPSFIILLKRKDNVILE